ncbi:PEFG-CTERM sorting domain-containing protein [Nitrosopumilus sp. Nsub]|uniref:PEFG-CTERM sorting domain-containing protein n=1 Tax=Nitrosopumilus sp. Nsub TaxID=1776294 RepID=UPI000AA9FC2C
MKKFILGIIFILILFPTSQSFSQEYTDTNPTLTVSTNSNTNYVYQDSEGHTVVIGVVENNDPLSFVTNVQVKAYFYDEFNPNPLEVKEGSTILDVIPPSSSSPFLIRSENPNSDIVDVHTKILTFETAPFMQNSLKISINDVAIEPMNDMNDSTYTFSFSGVLRNGNFQISETLVHFAFYDVFDRIVQNYTINIDEMDIDELTPIKLNEEIISSSVGFLLFSESDEFYSDTIKVELPEPESRTNLATTCGSSEVNIGGNCTSYDISGGHITSATVNTDDNSVIINIQAMDDGVLTISPSESTQKGIFMVLVDGEESNDAEINGNTVIVPFGAETEQIEIIGTFVIPEFGTIAAMILAVAIISIVAISAKSRLSIVPRY